MAAGQGHAMKINWIVASRASLNGRDLDQLHAIAPIWGSYRTWREFATDNVICHDMANARSCLTRNLPDRCNFYIPKSLFTELQRPDKVKLYDGVFDHDLDDAEDIVALHLASIDTDIVLLYQFDLFLAPDLDRYAAHKRRNYLGMVRSVIANSNNTQWVLIDSATPDNSFAKLPNFSCDSFENVLLLGDQTL
jgi:hypothetical protein